ARRTDPFLAGPAARAGGEPTHEHGLRPFAQFRHRQGSETYPACYVALEGTLVAGYLARATATGDGFFDHAADQFGTASGGGHESSGTRHCHALGLCGIAHGEHHTRLRLAVSRHRTPVRARFADG